MLETFNLQIELDTLSVQGLVLLKIWSDNKSLNFCFYGKNANDVSFIQHKLRPLQLERKLQIQLF